MDSSIRDLVGDDRNGFRDVLIAGRIRLNLARVSHTPIRAHGSARF